VDPGEFERRVQVLDTLRTLLPRMEAARRVYSASIERRNAILQEKSTLETAFEGIRPPSRLAFTIFLILIWMAAAGVALEGEKYVAGALCLVSLIPLVWYRRRCARSDGLRKQVRVCAGRLDACLVELKNTETEARQIEAEVRRLTGQDEIAQADIDARAAQIEKLSKIMDEIHRFDEVLVIADSEIQRLAKQVDEGRLSVQTLLAEASAETERDFIARADIFRQRQQLLGELEKLPVDPALPGLLFDMRADEDAAYEAARRELTEVEERLAQVRHDSGRIEERIEAMEKSEERSRAISRQETILARIDATAEQWAVLTLCRALLDETRKLYETERQPEVLRQASSFFSVMSEGRYSRVISPLDGGDIEVERSDGVRLSPQSLSRGTAEQLYLCMRLALVREYANHVEPLPVVFDDIFVNFDPLRSRMALMAIRELCTTHQVLVFTCHPHLVRYAEEIVPFTRTFPLQ
jgi:uncharacterized protein YhaN